MDPSWPSRTKFLFIKGHIVGSELAGFSLFYTLAFAEMSEAALSVLLQASFFFSIGRQSESTGRCGSYINSSFAEKCQVWSSFISVLLFSPVFSFGISTLSCELKEEFNFFNKNLIFITAD